MKTRFIVMIKGTVFQFVYCAYYSKGKKIHAIYQEDSKCPVKMNIYDFRLKVLQYDPVDIGFARLSLL